MMMMLTTLTNQRPIKGLQAFNTVATITEKSLPKSSTIVRPITVPFSAEHAQSNFLPVQQSSILRSGVVPAYRAVLSAEEILLHKGIRLFANSCLSSLNPEHHNPIYPAFSPMVDDRLSDAFLSMVPVKFYGNAYPNGSDVNDLHFLVSEVVEGLVPPSFKEAFSAFIAPTKTALTALKTELFSSQGDNIKEDVLAFINPHELSSTQTGTVADRLASIFPNYKLPERSVEGVPLSGTRPFPQNHFQSRYDVLAEIVSNFYEQHIERTNNGTLSKPEQIKQDLTSISTWLETKKTNTEEKGARNIHIQTLQNSIDTFDPTIPKQV